MKNTQEKIKRINWLNEFEDLVAKNRYHTIFQYQNNVKVTIGEPIQITLADPGEIPVHYGIGEVISVKECTIRSIDALDFSRQKPGYQSRKETLESFRSLYSEYRADINLNTLITIITIEKLDYNLNRLNTMVNKRRSDGLGKKVSDM